MAWWFMEPVIPTYRTLERRSGILCRLPMATRRILRGLLGRVGRWVSVSAGRWEPPGVQPVVGATLLRLIGGRCLIAATRGALTEVRLLGGLTGGRQRPAMFIRTGERPRR